MSLSAAKPQLQLQEYADLCRLEIFKKNILKINFLLIAGLVFL